MNFFRLIFADVALAFIFLFVLAVPSAYAKPKVPPPIDTRILIKSVDLKANTIEMKYMRNAKEPTHIYKIDDTTQVIVSNQKGKIGDIKVGMQVRNYLERDNDTLDNIFVDQADPPPAPVK
ncbi:MAG: hypothetical protein LV480_03365 [Methylacidiphilales bacterium]|nr:hypothetical protein [Candidatus Methylacidiphilales bacterium]